MRITVFKSRQSEQTQQLSDSLLLFVRLPPADPKRNILSDCKVWKHDDILKYHTNTPILGFDGMFRSRQSLTIHHDAAAMRKFKTCDQAHQSRFPASARTYDRSDFALFECEIDIRNNWLVRGGKRDAAKL